MSALTFPLLVVLAAPPAAGTYVLKGGSGHLELKKGQFTIETVGGNAHTCELSGTWSGEKAVTSDEPVCKVRFTAKPEGVLVEPLTEDACRNYCGARASFDGLYLTPRAECASAPVKATRTAFKKAYDAKQYAEAVKTLSALLDSCDGRLDRFETWWVRNDLALAQHHAGDDAACLRTLEPMGDFRFMSDEDAAGGEPSFEDLLRKIGHATRTNAKLCGFKAP